MDPFEGVDVDAVCSGRSDWLGPDQLAALSEHPLDCVATEFPHYVHAIEATEDVEPPSARHPVFYGCFDWHSAVHSHWCLVRVLRLFDDHPRESEIVAAIDARLAPEHVEREVAHLEANPSFEQPYGWGWLLRLAAELHLWEGGHGPEWRAVLEPLETTVVGLVESEFLPRERPFRVGTHDNSAFGLQCVLDYARVTGDDALASAAAETTRRFYGSDTDYPIEYEPLGWDFLSPALSEADLLRRVLEPDAFATWFEEFLPDLAAGSAADALEPVDVDPDAADGVALHLVGLNLSRAWSLAGIADALADHRAAPAVQRSARRHAEAGLAAAFTDDYAGAHWLSSFVLYLLTRNEGGIAPG